MIRFDEAFNDLKSCIGKKAHFVFVDDDEMDGIIQGFIPPGEYGGCASVDIVTEAIPGFVNIAEDEIKNINIE